MTEIPADFRVTINGRTRDRRFYEPPGSGNRLSRDFRNVWVPNLGNPKHPGWTFTVEHWEEIVMGIDSRDRAPTDPLNSIR